MSVIHIVDHNEVIYDALKTRKVIKNKPPRYKNYLNEPAPNIFQRKHGEDKKAFATMGPPEIPPPNPSDFLRKTPKKRRGKILPFERHCLKNDKNAPLPLIKIETVKKEEKNFVKNNVIEIKKSKPREPEPKIVDTKNGSVQKVKYLEPRYVYSKNFGKPPQYILQRVLGEKKLLQKQEDQRNLKSLSKCRYITRQERQNLLNGLKLNWEEMQKEFQLLPIITDTTPKIIRKTKLENELKELEKNILLIEKHPYIYVLDEE